MKACAVICRKATVIRPDANFFSFYAALHSSRAQNRHFCALLPFGHPVFGHFEHKIEVFVRFWGLEPLFSGLSSTKSRFLCFFGVWNTCFQAFRAQNRGFCARAAGQVASGSEKVTFLQITAHTSKMQILHNQIINF